MGGRPKTVLSERLGKDDAEAFDALARASPFAACQQSRAWAEAAPRRGRHDFLYFLCRDGEEAMGAAIVRRTRLAPGVWLATAQRGPIVADVERLAEVVRAFNFALAQAGCCTVILGPRVAGEGVSLARETLSRARFRTLRTQSLHVQTGKIPLSGTEEEIFARFKQRGRRAIRKAAAVMTVREGAAGDIPHMESLLSAFHARRPDYDVSGQLDVRAQAKLIAAEGGAMLVAEEGGRIVGWHSFVRQGRDAIWLAMVTDDDPQAPRSYLLLWEAVRRARALGLASYDLAGLSPDDEASGRDQFKQAFAPVREELLPAQVAALRPLRHAIFFTARQLYRARRKG